MPQNQHQQSAATATPPARSGAKSGRFRFISCPTCGKQGNWPAAPSGPFCSWRCRLIDLGRWLNEEYAFGEAITPAHLEKGAEASRGGRLNRSVPG